MPASKAEQQTRLAGQTHQPQTPSVIGWLDVDVDINGICDVSPCSNDVVKARE
jgi:hypothetical protein